MTNNQHSYLLELERERERGWKRGGGVRVEHEWNKNSIRLKCGSFVPWDYSHAHWVRCFVPGIVYRERIGRNREGSTRGKGEEGEGGGERASEMEIEGEACLLWMVRWFGRVVPMVGVVALCGSICPTEPTEWDRFSFPFTATLRRIKLHTYITDSVSLTPTRWILHFQHFSFGEFVHKKKKNSNLSNIIFLRLKFIAFTIRFGVISSINCWIINTTLLLQNKIVFNLIEENFQFNRREFSI